MASKVLCSDCVYSFPEVEDNGRQHCCRMKKSVLNTDSCEEGSSVENNEELTEIDE